MGVGLRRLAAVWAGVRTTSMEGSDVLHDLGGHLRKGLLEAHGQCDPLSRRKPVIVDLSDGVGPACTSDILFISDAHRIHAQRVASAPSSTAMRVRGSHSPSLAATGCQSRSKTPLALA